MRPIPPVDSPRVHQADVGFVDQRSRLKRMVGPLAAPRDVQAGHASLILTAATARRHRERWLEEVMSGRSASSYSSHGVHLDSALCPKPHTCCQRNKAQPSGRVGAHVVGEQESRNGGPMTMTERQVGPVKVLSLAGKLTLDDAGQLKGKVTELVGAGAKAACPQPGRRDVYRQLGPGRDGQLPHDRQPGARRRQARPSGQTVSGSAGHHQAEHGL